MAGRCNPERVPGCKGIEALYSDTRAYSHLQI